jgi:hypothetical protein
MFATLAALIPVYLIVIGLQVVVQLVAQPFLLIYLTYMFVDQVRRSEMPPAPAFGYGGAPYYTPPGQYYQPGPPQPGQPQPPQAGWQVPPPNPQQPPQPPTGAPPQA